MNNIVTARDLLGGNLQDFSPLDIDLGEIKALSAAMPKDGNIDLNNSEVLATKYLRGADLCSELLAVATAYAQKADTMKKKAYSHAALIKSVQSGVKTDKSRAWFAEMDEEFIEASNKYSEAVAFVKWISNKYDSFNKMHYMCKKILDRGYVHERMSGFTGSDGEDDKPW